MKALITGASSGIGKEIARYLAELGYDLILVSRSTDKLNKLKEELSNVNVRVITLDFSRESDSMDLYEHIKNENEQIDFLVNNAGFGAYGFCQKLLLLPQKVCVLRVMLQCLVDRCQFPLQIL